MSDIDVDHTAVRSFAKFKDELTVSNDNSLILRDTRIVLPKALQRRALDIAHEGHLGMSKTKALVRTKVWFPGIDKSIETMIRECLPCQATTPEERREPLNMSELPEGPWQHVSMDFCGPLPTGEYLLVIFDEYSRYPVVEVVNSTSAKTVLPVVDKVFSMFGVPVSVKTDNGPPFNGNDFANFAKYLGFRHRKITPLWPQANSQAERINQPLMKTIRAAKIQGRNWRQELYEFLRNYRMTPHASTKSAPAKLMLAYTMRFKFPQTKYERDGHDMIKQNDREAKLKMKRYADASHRSKPSNLQLDDRVLLRNKRENKLTPAFDPQPYTVVGRMGSMISAKRGERVITRNASFFKHVPLIRETNPESDRDDDDVTEVDDAQQPRPVEAPHSPDAQECSDDANQNVTPRSEPKSRETCEPKSREPKSRETCREPKSRETTCREPKSREPKSRATTFRETTSRETPSREMTPRATISRETTSCETTPRATTYRESPRYPVRLGQRPGHLSNFEMQ